MPMPAAPAPIRAARCLVLAAVLGFAAGCSQFPALDAAAPPQAGPAPVLLPMDQVLAAVPPAAADPAPALAARAARLRARAAALR